MALLDSSNNHSIGLELAIMFTDIDRTKSIPRAVLGAILSHLNKIGEEIRETIRAKGDTYGLGQGRGCGGEGHGSCFIVDRFGF